MTTRYNFDNDYAMSEESVRAVIAAIEHKHKNNPNFVKAIEITDKKQQKQYGDIRVYLKNSQKHYEVKTDRRLDRTSENVMVEYYSHWEGSGSEYNRNGWFKGYGSVDGIIFHPEYSSSAYYFPYPAFKAYVKSIERDCERFKLNNGKWCSAGLKVNVNRLMENVDGAMIIRLYDNLK